MNIGDEGDGIYVDVPDPAQIPAHNAQAVPAQLFAQRFAEMLVASPPDGIDSGCVDIATCFLIQSGLYADDDVVLAQNDAAELSKSFPSRPAASASNFLKSV